jgi:filamentous haemagglutinin family N-terminal domain
VTSRFLFPHGAAQALALAILVALGGAPAQAQIVPANGSPHQPGVDHAGNGTPVVNIAAPGRSGVSRNQYEHFNVDPRGLVLNNSGAVSQTQQAGFVVGNPNLGHGASARIIVNEVISGNASSLRGFTEVAGHKADIVIANPNGIRCQGCGFINTSRATLVTGSPVFDGDGGLTAFRVTRGQLAIDGTGLNGNGADRLDLIARTVAANAKVWARELNVVTGANHVNYADLGTHAIAGEGRVGVSLDVAALGGMYAEKIRLLGTEAGVGVRNAGELATQGGDFTITQAGRLELTGKVASAGQLDISGAALLNHGTLAAGTNITVATAGAIDNEGTLYGRTGATLASGGTLTHSGDVYAMGGRLDIDAGAVVNTGQIYAAAPASVRTGLLDNRAVLRADGDLVVHAASVHNVGSTYSGGIAGWTIAQELANSGTIAAKRDLSLTAGALASTGVLGAGVEDNGSLGATGVLDVAVVGDASIHGDALAASRLTLSGASLDLTGSRIRTAGDMRLDARRGDVGTASAKVAAEGALAIHAAGALTNHMGTLQSRGPIDINVDRLANGSGRIKGLSSELIRLDIGKHLSNGVGGFIGGNGGLWLRAGALDNAGQLYAHAAADIATSGWLINHAAIQAAGASKVSAGAGLDNRGGRIESGSDAASATMVVTAGVIANAGGRIVNSGTGETRISTAGAIGNANGTLGGEGSVTIDASSIDNTAGRIVAGRDLDVSLPGDLVNDGDGEWKAHRNFGLHLGGSLLNRDGAALESVGALTIDATSIDNSGGARISSATTTLKASGTINNRGRLEGDILAVSGTDIENTGSFIGDRITVRAHNLTNGADLGEQVDNGAYQSALIAATEDIKLLVRGTFLNRDAMVFSLGDILIAGDDAGARAHAIVNRSGDIEADQRITLAASQIINERRVFETGTVRLPDGAVRKVSGPVVRYAYNDPDPNHRPPMVDASQVVSADEIRLARSVCRGAGYKNNRCIGFRNGTGTPTTFQGTFTDSLTAYERLIRASVESRFVAGTDITLSGSVTNDKSTVAAGRNLFINGTSQASSGPGEAFVGGEIVRNIGWNPTGTVRTDMSYGVGWESLVHDPRRWEPNGFRVYGSGSRVTTVALGDGQRPDWVAIDPGQGLPSRMTAGETLAFHGRRIENTTVDADGNPIAGVRLGANAGAFDVTGDVDLGRVGPRPGSQSVGSPDAPFGRIRLPSSGLYTTHPGTAAPYLIETDPRFATRAGFIGSDYLMQRLGFNGVAMMKRLGDGFYEQRLVLDQITSLTGRRFLTDNTDAMAQYRALMDAGAATAESFHLSVGVALTAEQMAHLAHDIVWLVSQEVGGEKVLVPVVYLSAARAQEVAHNGAILSGKTVALDATDKLINTGTIVSGEGASLVVGTLLNGGNLSTAGNLSVTAARDILNAGVVRGGNVSLAAAGDILSGPSIDGVPGIASVDVSRLGLARGGLIDATGHLAARAGRDLTLGKEALSAGADLSLSAKRDLSLTATGLKAGGDVELQAGRDMTISALGHTVAVQGGKRNSENTTHTVASLEAGGNVVLAAGQDLTAEGLAASAAQQLVISAGRDVTLNAVTDVERNDDRRKEGQALVTKATTAEVSSGGSLSGRQGVHVRAGRDMAMQGAQVNSDGDIELAAGRDIQLEAIHDRYSETRDSLTKKSGYSLNRGLAPVQRSKSTERHSATTQTIAHGTILSGDSVTVAAGRDLRGEGAQIAASNDVLLVAGKDLTLNTAENTYSTVQEKSVSRTGFSRDGHNERYGKVRDTQGQGGTDITHTGSLVGSTGGQVTLTAGNHVHLTGTDVISDTVTTMLGKNVTIDAAVDTSGSSQYQRHNEGGVTVGLGGSMVALAMDAQQSTRRAAEVGDGRLKALYAARAAYDVKDAYDSLAANGAGSGEKGKAGQEGINVQASLGGKSSSSKTTSQGETAFGSHIRSRGDVVIAATDGDINVIGSEVIGNNIALAATRDINLQSQAEQHSLKNDARNGSGGVGVSFGTDGFGIYAEASVGSGKARGNGTTHAETTIQAGNTLTLISGNDTTIQGAQLMGNRVVADIGNNLNVRSEKDTDDFASKTMQAGAKVMFGLTQSGFVSASGYYAQSKVNSHYASVNEVSGIKAGAEGFQLYVGGVTHLIGGQIASSADASRNVLNTGDLVWESLHNESTYKASQIRRSGGSTLASNISGAVGTALGALTPQRGDSDSETLSGIANGTIIVRNDTNKDISGLIRDPSLDAAPLKNAYDAKKVAEAQEMVAQSGYVGMRSVGAFADYKQKSAKTTEERDAWQDGGRNKIILHGIVGAAMAALGGHDVAAGVAGATAGVVSSKAMQRYLLDRGVTPGSDDWNAFMELGSAVVGGLAGGGIGATAAVAGDKYNRQIHPGLVSLISTDLAAKYAERKGISIEDARRRMIRSVMVSTDRVDAGFVQHLDTEADRTDALNFLYMNVPRAGHGLAYDLTAYEGEYDDTTLGAYAIAKDRDAMKYVFDAMNPEGSRGLEKRLFAHFKDASFPEAFAEWKGKDSALFLDFNANLALAGGTGGLNVGVPFLAAANAARNGRTVSSMAGYILASRAGAGVAAGSVNAASQYALDGAVRPINVLVAAGVGSLGIGGGFRWNASLGSAGGFVQTNLNNWLYQENKDAWVSSLVSGVAGGSGYKTSDLLTRRLATRMVNSTTPSIIGGINGFWNSEVLSWHIDKIISEVERRDVERRDAERRDTP